GCQNKPAPCRHGVPPRPAKKAMTVTAVCLVPRPAIRGCIRAGRQLADERAICPRGLRSSTATAPGCESGGPCVTRLGRQQSALFLEVKAKALQVCAAQVPPPGCPTATAGDLH